MDITTFNFIFDTGLFVLIWIVQLIIYPSFRYYSAKNLLAWHTEYTPKFSIIVIPLMFGQLITTTLSLILYENAGSLVSLILVITVWFITFLVFVPIHQKIAQGHGRDELLQKLVTANWIRTLIWSILFVGNALRYL